MLTLTDFPANIATKLLAVLHFLQSAAAANIITDIDVRAQVIGRSRIHLPMLLLLVLCATITFVWRLNDPYRVYFTALYSTNSMLVCWTKSIVYFATKLYIFGWHKISFRFTFMAISDSFMHKRAVNEIENQPNYHSFQLAWLLVKLGEKWLANSNEFRDVFATHESSRCSGRFSVSIDNNMQHQTKICEWWTKSALIYDLVGWLCVENDRLSHVRFSLFWFEINFDIGFRILATNFVKCPHLQL